MYEEIKNEIFYKKLLKRDKSSFKTLYELFKIPLYKIIFSIVKNEEKTADIIQDTFIKAIRKIDQLKSINSIEYWLYRIAINSSINIIHKNKKLSYSGEMIGHLSDQNTADNFIKTKNNKKKDNYYLLLELIDELPTKYKIIISLKYIDNLKEVEISHILNIPVGTVKSRLNIARNKLRTALTELKT